MMRSQSASSGEVRIGIVQTNVPQSNKVNWQLEDQVNDLERFIEMTREVAAMDPPPDIIVWPETMFPGDTLSPDVVEAQRDAGLSYARLSLPATYFHDQLVAAQRELGIPFVIGAIARDGYRLDVLPSGGASVHTDRIFNSAFVVVDGTVQEHRYDKTFLTPFGEVMPYISAWPWLEQKLLRLGRDRPEFRARSGHEPEAPHRAPSRWAARSASRRRSALRPRCRARCAGWCSRIPGLGANAGPT